MLSPLPVSKKVYLTADTWLKLSLETFGREIGPSVIPNGNKQEASNKPGTRPKQRGLVFDVVNVLS